MSGFTKNFSRQYVGLFAVLFIGFALIFTASAESAQTSKTKSKTAPTPKKNAKATPAPKKSPQAKATPTPKKNDKQKTTSTSKTTDKNKKTSAKTTDKNSSKNSKDTKKSSTTTSKTTDKNKKSNDKTSTNKKPADKNSSSKNSAKTDSSKSKSSTGKDTKNTSKNVAAKNDKKTPATKSSTPKTAPKTSSETPKTQSVSAEIIVTNIAARLRNQAKSNAPEVSRVKLGTILEATEKSSSWYKVKYSSGGKTNNGWISADSVENLKDYKRSEIYRQMIDSNYKPQMDFAAAAELIDFLSQIKGADSSAELELRRLTLLRETLRKIPSEKVSQSPYREFLKSNDQSIVYSEPAGEWYVSSNQFWDLHKKYSTSPLADKIAWEASQNPLPGECEGYVNCHLFYVRMTTGEYLRLHPQGANAANALKDLSSFIEPIAADAAQKTVYQAPTDATDRAEFNNLIAELRTIVTRLAFPEKERTLQQIKSIGEAFR